MTGQRRLTVLEEVKRRDGRSREAHHLYAGAICSTEDRAAWMRSFTAPSPEGRGEEPERAAAAVAAGAPAGWLMLRSWAARLLMSRSALCTSWLISCRDATKCQHRMRPPPQMSSFPGGPPHMHVPLSLGHKLAHQPQRRCKS